jgi:tRNA threonylcarbamoyladenosine biosynthesis protein TsaE
MKLYLADPAATEQLAGRLLRALPADTAGWTVLLDGELGAGKSTLARALIKALGHTGPVPSPTYTLVEPYRISDRNIYHIDLYRISGDEELRYLGWTELDDGLRLVEWPERAPGLLQQADLKVSLSYDGDGRSADIEGLSERGAQLVTELGVAYSISAAGLAKQIN